MHHNTSSTVAVLAAASTKSTKKTTLPLNLPESEVSKEIDRFATIATAVFLFLVLGAPVILILILFPN